MKNRLADLNNHLFAQIERLSDEELSKEQIEAEAKRAESVVAVADQIVKTARISLDGVKFVAEHGGQYQDALPMLASPKESGS